MVLKKNPDSRPSIDAVLHHHFLSAMTDEEGRALLRHFVAGIPDLDAMEPEVKETAEEGAAETTAVRWRFE